MGKFEQWKAYTVFTDGPKIFICSVAAELQDATRELKTELTIHHGRLDILLSPSQYHIGGIRIRHHQLYGARADQQKGITQLLVKGILFVKLPAYVVAPGPFCQVKWQ